MLDVGGVGQCPVPEGRDLHAQRLLLVLGVEVRRPGPGPVAGRDRGAVNQHRPARQRVGQTGAVQCGDLPEQR